MMAGGGPASDPTGNAGASAQPAAGAVACNSGNMVGTSEVVGQVPVDAPSLSNTTVGCFLPNNGGFIAYPLTLVP